MSAGNLRTLTDILSHAVKDAAFWQWHFCTIWERLSYYCNLSSLMEGMRRGLEMLTLGGHTWEHQTPLIGKWNCMCHSPRHTGIKDAARNHSFRFVLSSREYVLAISVGSSALWQEGYHVSGDYNSKQDIPYLSVTSTWCRNAYTCGPYGKRHNCWTEIRGPGDADVGKPLCARQPVQSWPHNLSSAPLKPCSPSYHSGVGKRILTMQIGTRGLLWY